MPAILAIRDDPGEQPLSDPRALSDADAARLIAAGSLLVWQRTDGPVSGFAASDTQDGSIRALLVAPGQEGRGIGRALLAAACATLRAASHAVATLAIERGNPAERHYRAAGWTVVRHNDRSELVLRKPL